MPPYHDLETKLTLTNSKDIATIIGVGVAVATLLKGLWDYHNSAVLRRIEYFARLKEQFLKDAAFAKLTELLETDDPGLGEISARDKWRYLAFFEEVALLLRARLIRDELACYMFGYYALLCDRSQWFWSPALPKDEAYWLLFFNFVERMRPIERSKHVNPKNFLARIST